MDELISQFMFQLDVGCGNEECIKPWCLSHRMRVSSKPLRPLTLLSSLALATHLAALPNAEENYLCIDEEAYPEHAGPRKDRKSFTQLIFDTDIMQRLDPSETSFPLDVSRIRSYQIGVEHIKEAILREWTGTGFGRNSTKILNLLAQVDAHPSQPFKAMFIHHLVPWRLPEALVDSLALAREWFDEPAGTKHVLQFPWMFQPSCQAANFRALCFQQLRRASAMSTLHRRMMSQSFGLIADGYSVSTADTSASQYFAPLGNAGKSYLCLEMSRENFLRDTFDQLWGKQIQEFRLPLRVKITNEGEEGLDHGGVAQEYLCLVFADFLKPERALFNIDESSGIAWFDPRSIEPPHYYRFMGLILGLAVSNGFALPVSFPLIMYKGLLKRFDERDCLEIIRDGWPELHSSFTQLLDMDESDESLEDVLSRPYAFTMRTLDGRDIEIDMVRYSHLDESWKGWKELLTPTEQSDTATAVPEPPLINIKNREDFIVAYVTWLVFLSVRDPMLEFIRGFRLCWEPRALETLTPECLQALVEGSGDISVDDLRSIVKYDGYERDEPVIKDFWDVVHTYTPDRLKALLKFVTASDRVPATANLRFTIIRQGYSDSEQLPTSRTCFNYLLLPPYSTKEKLERKLSSALDENVGFGMA